MTVLRDTVNPDSMTQVLSHARKKFTCAGVRRMRGFHVVFTASLLNCSSISSFLNLCSIPMKISDFPLHLLMFFLAVLHADPLSKVHLNNCASFFISVLSSPFGCLHTCGVSSAHLPSLYLNLHPYHSVRPSLRSFCCSANIYPAVLH